MVRVPGVTQPTAAVCLARPVTQGVLNCPVSVAHAPAPCHSLLLSRTLLFPRPGPPSIHLSPCRTGAPCAVCHTPAVFVRCCVTTLTLTRLLISSCACVSPIRHTPPFPSPRSLAAELSALAPLFFPSFPHLHALLPPPRQTPHRPTMLHSTKRVLLRPLHVSPALDEDIAAWQQKLSNVSAALSAASASIDAQRDGWERLFTAADTFASDLHTLYPNDDEVRALGKRSRTATAALLAGLATVDAPLRSGGAGGGTGPPPPPPRPPPPPPPGASSTAATAAAAARASSAAAAAAASHRTVKAYLAEIETLTREYPKVAAARRAVAAADRRVEALLGKRRVDDAKVGRAAERRDGCEAVYGALKAGLLERMRSTYAKHPGVFKAAYAAFFCSWEACDARAEAELGALGGVARTLASRAG